MEEYCSFSRGDVNVFPLTFFIVYLSLSRRILRNILKYFTIFFLQNLRPTYFFLIGIVGGGVQLGPLGTAATNGLLCQPRVIIMMEKLVERWLAGETEVLGENLPQCRFVHHKPHMLPGRGGKPASNR
jgi:hypothetical protein